MKGHEKNARKSIILDAKCAIYKVLSHKKPQVTIGKDEAIYKLLGEVESRQELESKMPDDFKSFNYNWISGIDWEVHLCVEDEPYGLSAAQNDHYKYVVNGKLITLADEHHRRVV